VIRSPPSRPEVTLDKVKVSSRMQAVHALNRTDPQMVISLFGIVGALLCEHASQILVMTKAAGLRLQQELTTGGKQPHFFHSGLAASQKETIHFLIGRELVIATTGTYRKTNCIVMRDQKLLLRSNIMAGFITGLNSPSLFKAVVWEFVYSFESLVQFVGRLARVRGQKGSCTFITWDEAINCYSKGDADSLEISRALNSDANFHDLVMRTLHTDAARGALSVQPQQTLAQLKAAVSGLKW
jgi:hypothetical protein